MLEPFILKSRENDMLCLTEYVDYKERGRKVIIIRHGFCGDMSLTYRLMTDFCHLIIKKGIQQLGLIRLALVQVKATVRI